MTAPWSPPSEPLDLREQPECICPPEGPAVEGCPLCDFLRGVEQATREDDRVMGRPPSGMERAEWCILGPDDPECDIPW